MLFIHSRPFSFSFRRFDDLSGNARPFLAPSRYLELVAVLPLSSNTVASVSLTAGPVLHSHTRLFSPHSSKLFTGSGGCVHTKFYATAAGCVHISRASSRRFSSTLPNLFFTLGLAQIATESVAWLSPFSPFLRTGISIHLLKLSLNLISFDTVIRLTDETVFVYSFSRSVTQLL